MENCSFQEDTDSNIELQTFPRVQFIVNCVLLPMICIAGCCGNGALIFLLAKSLLWKALRVYLLALAVWDVLLLLSSSLVFLPASLLEGSMVDQKNSFVHAYPVLWVIYNACFRGHIWSTVALTFERYLAICHTFWHRRVMNQNVLRCVCLSAIAVVSIGLSMAYYFEVQVVSCVHPTSRAVHSFLVPTVIHSNFYYQKYFKVLASLMFASLVPLALLILFTCKIICTVRRGVLVETADRLYSHRRTVVRMRYTQQHKLRNGADRPLLYVLFMCISCYLLPTAADIIEFCLDLDSVASLRDILNYTALAGNFMVCASAATSFFVYAYASARFRKEIGQHIVQKIPKCPMLSSWCIKEQTQNETCDLPQSSSNSRLLALTESPYLDGTVKDSRL